MASIGDIVATLRMDSTKFTHGAKKAQSSARKTGAAMSVMGKAAKVAGVAMLAVAAVKAVGRAAGSIILKSADLDAALQKSIAIQKLTIEQQNAMRVAAIAVANDVSASAAEVAEGYFYLASAGLDAEQQIAALPQVAAFAQALATDLATDAQSAIGLTSTDAAENLEGLKLVTDTLIGANVLANAKAEEFAKALTSGAAASARDAGKDITEVVAVLAAFATQGIKGAEAGTAFSIVMRDLQTKAIKNKQAFADAGITVFDGDKMRSIAAIVGDLETSMAGLGVEQRKVKLLDLGFTDQSIGALQKLLGMSGQIDEYQAKLKGMAGITQEVAAKSMTDFDRSLNRLSKSWAQLMISAGTPIVDSGAVPLINGLAWALEKLAEAAQLVADTFETAKSEMRTFGKILEEFPGVNFGLAEADAQKLRETTAEYEAEMKARADAAAKAAKVAEEAAKASEKWGMTPEEKAAMDAADVERQKAATATATAAATADVEKRANAQKNLNTEVERFSQLTSSAAMGDSVEAYSRIFETIAAGRQPKPDDGNIADKAVGMVMGAGAEGAAVPASEAGKDNAQVLNGILKELRQTTKAVKQLNEDAEGI